MTRKLEYFHLMRRKVYRHSPYTNRIYIIFNCSWNIQEYRGINLKRYTHPVFLAANSQYMEAT